MPSYVPNYPPNYGSMMQYFSQTPPLSSTPTGDENVSRATEFSEFSTQIALGGASEPISDANANESAQARRKIPKWTTDQNLVLLSRGGHFGYFLGSVRVRFGLVSSVLEFFRLK